MIAFENLTPVRLSELVDGRNAAAALMGPVVAIGWGASAVGAAAVPWLLRRWSATAVSVTLRIVQGVTVVAMGLAWGPVGLVAGYVATYLVHSAAGAIYETLLHEQVTNEHRATVLSLSSMAMQPAASFGSVVLGLIATGVSTGVAIMVGGVVLALAAPLFLVRPRTTEVRPAVAGRGAARR
jgi:predicted MFS family arabinose efflux permease